MIARSAESGLYFDPCQHRSDHGSRQRHRPHRRPHGEDQTKPKAHFTQVYYSRELEECYSLLWQAVDKHGFLDKALDAPVEGGK